MNTQAMNHDPHSPVFIRGKATPNKQVKEPVHSTRSIDWRRIIELALLLTLVVATEGGERQAADRSDKEQKTAHGEAPTHQSLRGLAGQTHLA